LSDAGADFVVNTKNEASAGLFEIVGFPGPRGTQQKKYVSDKLADYTFEPIIELSRRPFH
jgi:hypothetical protein